MTDDAITQTDQFTLVNNAEPHLSRVRTIIKAHPEVRKLTGPTSWTFLVLIALVAAQITLALLLRKSPVWMLMLVAYVVGAVI